MENKDMQIGTKTLSTFQYFVFEY